MTCKDRFPYFKFYPSDFILDMTVEGWPVRAIGGYIMLICYCWQYDGLPNDDKTLAKLSQLGRSFATNSHLIRSKFVVGEDGRLHHKRLDEERAKANHISNQNRDNVEKRWRKKQLKSYTTVLPTETETETETETNNKKAPPDIVSSPEDGQSKLTKANVQWMVDQWNEQADSRYARVGVVNAARERSVRRCWSEIPRIEAWTGAIRYENSNEYNLSKRHGFDTMIRPANYAKYAEAGMQDNGQRPGRSSAISKPQAGRQPTIRQIICDYCGWEGAESEWLESSPGSMFRDTCPECKGVYRSWTPEKTK